MRQTSRLDSGQFIYMAADGSHCTYTEHNLCESGSTKSRLSDVPIRHQSQVQIRIRILNQREASSKKLTHFARKSYDRHFTFLLNWPSLQIQRVFPFVLLLDRLKPALFQARLTRLNWIVHLSALGGQFGFH